MPNEFIARFRRWFDYEREAHAKVIHSLESVPAERRTAPEFRRAVTLLAHIVAGRHLWLYRLGKLPAAPTSFFPEGLELSKVTADLKAIHEHWSKYLAELSDDDLKRTFDYRSLDAGGFRNTLEEILTQLFGHSWYHRGQIAMLVRTAGGEPAVTDFIFWCRQPTA
jgi:uncharacterized damage-inducible protein DinB